jgi:hypothetical protein
MLEWAGWICGGITLLGVVALGVTYFLASRSMAKDQERFERDGELHMCWISSAGDDLYKVFDVPGAGNARVVFLLDNIPNRQALLQEITERLKNGKKADNAVDRAQVSAFFEKINQQSYLDAPVRMPQWLVGDVDAYTAMMEVYWRKLPEMKLTKPFVYGRVILGESGGVRHVSYPAEVARGGGSA